MLRETPSSAAVSLRVMDCIRRSHATSFSPPARMGLTRELHLAEKVLQLFLLRSGL